MSKPKHTPGPWTYAPSDRLSDGSDCIQIEHEGGSIAEMQCPADAEEANARLIAAAPTLYEALKATPCRYLRTKTCVAAGNRCDRCAALALVESEDK